MEGEREVWREWGGRKEEEEGGRERRRGRTENSRIPMLFRNPIETGKHDGKDDVGVFFYQTHDVFIIPIIEGPFCHLPEKKKKMLTERKMKIKQNYNLFKKSILRLF